jgi:hypothetical protein
LAERTGSASTEISGLVSGIQQVTLHAQQQMMENSSDASKFSADGLASTESMKLIHGVAYDLEGSIIASSLRSFIEVVKVDHLIIKFDVYKVLMGLPGVSVEDFTTHNTCRLGKWYYTGRGKACFAHLGGYKDVDKPHKELHLHGKAALDCFYAGNMEQAMLALERMEAASMLVLQGLDQIAASGEADHSQLRQDSA